MNWALRFSSFIFRVSVLLCLAFVVGCPAFGQTVNFVPGASGSSTGTGYSCAVTPASGFTSGQLTFVGIIDAYAAVVDVSGYTLSVSDGVNSYTQVAGSPFTDNSKHTKIAYWWTKPATGSPTVTLSTSNSSANLSCFVVSYTVSPGSWPSSPIDQTPTPASLGDVAVPACAPTVTLSSSTTGTTSQAVELEIGIFGINNSFSTWVGSGGFTARFDPSVTGNQTEVEDAVTSSTGTYTATSAICGASTGQTKAGAGIIFTVKTTSGTAYTATPSESNTASDTISRLAAFARTDSESTTASDAIARKVSFGRGDSESNAASDTIARKAGFGRGDSESNTPSDAIARSAVCGRGDSETNNTADSLARLAGFGRGNSESSTASDAIARSAVYGRGGSETNNTADSLARLARFGRSDSESNPASDSLVRLAAFGRADNESNPASDAVTSLETVPGTYSAALYETNTISDTVAIAQVLNRSDSESHTASDAIARLAGFGRGENESRTTSDSIARSGVFGRDDSETNAASDVIARSGVFRRGDNETLSASDNLRRVLAASRSDAEALSTSDSLSRIFAALRGDMETLVFSDAIVGLRNYSLTVLPGHEFAVPGHAKSGTAPVH